VCAYPGPSCLGIAISRPAASAGWVRRAAKGSRLGPDDYITPKRRGRCCQASSPSGTRFASRPDWTLAYVNPAGSALWGSTRPSWLREVMSSLAKTLRRW